MPRGANREGTFELSDASLTVGIEVKNEYVERREGEEKKRSVGMRWHGPDWSLPVGSACGHGVWESSLIHASVFCLFCSFF